MGRKSIYRKILLFGRDLLILVVIGSIIGIIQNRGESFSFRMMLEFAFPSIGIGYPLFKGSIFLVGFLDKKIPWIRYPLKRLIIQFSSMVIFCSLVIILFTVLWYTFVQKQDFDLIRIISIEGLKIGLTILILSSLLVHSFIFFKNWKTAAVQQEKLKHEHLALQYDTLVNQVNPHFLFNSLNSLTALIDKDPEKAGQFVKKLSEIYRYVLNQNVNELVSVESELKFLESYIFLQKIRFAENLIISIDVTLIRRREVIPLSLQMLLENAIKHNIISKDHPLFIEIYSTDEDYIGVKNNNQKKTAIDGSTGLGIENIKSRYEFFTNKPVKKIENQEYYMVELPTIKPENNS